MEHVGSHKSEHRHNVVEDRLRTEARQGRHQQQRLLERLGIVGSYAENEFRVPPTSSASLTTYQIHQHFQPNSAR